MGGFQVPVQTAVIDFIEGHRFHGAEVKVTLSVPLELVLWFRGSAELKEGTVEDIRATLERFGSEVLLEWNILDAHGEAIPADSDGMLRIDQDLAATVMTEWAKAVASPPAPLSNGSGSGETTEGPLTETVTGSTSPQS